MERVRPPHSSDGSMPETIGPLPSEHSLPVLLDVVRSPGVMRADVDALLQGLVRPLAESESPRSRADFLLSLLESDEVGDMVGSDGTSVRSVAVQALLDMGYPYALEIPPEALGGRSGSRDADRPQKIPVPGLIALLAGFITQSVTLVPPLFDFVERRSSSDQTFGLILLGLVLLPSFLLVLGGALRMRILQRLGVITVALTGGVWMIDLLQRLFTSSQPLSHLSTYVSLVAGLGFLLGSFFTRTPEWLAEEQVPQPEETPKTEP